MRRGSAFYQGRSTWPSGASGRISKSLGYLGLGSVFLFLGGFLLWQFEPGWGTAGLLAFFAFLAMPIHLLAWVHLGIGLKTSGEPLGLPEKELHLVWGLFVGSILAFTLSLLTLPLLFGDLWELILTHGLFAYLPTVFGPVVLLQALLFVRLRKAVSRRAERAAFAAGAFLLAGVAGLGIALFLVIRFLPDLLPSSLIKAVWMTAGATCAAYLLMFIAWTAGLRYGGSAAQPGPSSSKS